MSIYEPCNYASNVAYYHALWEICMRDGWNLDEDHGMARVTRTNVVSACTTTIFFAVLAMVRSAAFLAHGSAFFHASETILGGELDVKVMDLFMFVIYRAATSQLDSSNVVIHHLSSSRRSCSYVHM